MSISTRTLRTDRPSAPRASAWAVAALGLTLAGCTSQKSLGDECLFNADCADPLICAARRCRAQCGSDRDCPRGEFCANAGQPGKRVCVQPQSAQLCAYNSDCSARSTCADGLCHAVCSMDGDCARPPASNTCLVARMICSEPDRVFESVTTDDGGVPGDGSAPADASGDAAISDAPTSDAAPPMDAPPMDAPPMDAAVGDAAVTDVADGALADASSGDGATSDGSDAAALDAAMGDVTDAARSDASDATAADVGDAAVLSDGGMVCVGTPDLQNDLDNCGRCGNRCPRPSVGTGTVTCTAGLCVTSCAAGFSNCNGLCTDLRTDLDHCGRCGNVCEVGCTAGVCVNPVEVISNWNGGALVRLSDDTWRGFGPGNWASETGVTPAVFPWAGSREVPSPLPIPLTGQNLIPAHPSHLYRITATGTLQGIGASGSLGDGTNVSRTRWTDVPGITAVRDVTSAQNGIYSVSCAAYGAEGRVSCWGSALAYAYGNPMTAVRAQPSDSVPVLRFDDQPLTGVVRVRRGTSFTLALRDNGEVWSWGVNGDGRLGLGFASGSDYAAQARRIPTLPPCTSIATGLEFACALDNAGAVWCWGRNDAGQVGDGTTLDRSVPTRVVTADPAMPTRDIPLDGVVAITTSTAGACAITASRNLYCWGQNIVGQAGVNLPGNVPRASRVPAPPGVATLRVQSVSIADNFGCLLTVAETTPVVVPPRVYCWGYEGNSGYPSAGRIRAPNRPVFW